MLEDVSEELATADCVTNEVHEESKPFSTYFKKAQYVGVRVALCSFSSNWYKGTHLETYTSTKNKRLIGFDFKCYQKLVTKMNDGEIKSTLSLLWYGLKMDLSPNSRKDMSNKECLKLYAKLFWLVLKHPGTWFIGFINQE